jgi:hypothetical protein
MRCRNRQDEEREYQSEGRIMWLMTNFGFFSIVKKEGEENLTVRARAKQDLLSLKDRYLPQMGAIEVSDYNDYRYRVRVPREVFAEALRDIALDIDYPNFKNSVAKKQGKGRARVYEDVWQRLYGLQSGDCA